MHRKPVESSAVSSVGYDPRSEVLEVEFRSGAVYDYFEVPRGVYESLMKASSKGRFVSRRIRDRFPFERRGS
ncbi:MAG TPA: KTSC domain-containing protein [Thermoanaerobaculia bacterium]|nr:KTSC domain-containing protein [Thermoanaerobaculia bacterium]